MVGRLVFVDRESWIDPVDRIGRVGAQHRVSRLGPVDRLCGIDLVRFLSRIGPVGSALSAKSRWSLLSSGGDHDVLVRRLPPLPTVLVAGGVALAVLLTARSRKS
jgi:hypothetical protein